MYRLQYERTYGERKWVLCDNMQTPLPGCQWYAGEEYYASANAIFAAKAAQKNWPGFPWRVINTYTDEIVWESDGHTTQMFHSNREETEMDVKPEISEPIKLSREKVITRLTEIHDKEKAEREEKQKKENADRKEVEAFIRDNADRVAEYLKAKGGQTTWSLTLDDLTDREFKGDNYKPKDKEPTRRESDTEHFVRVLEMSDDDTIALTPDAELYELL